MIHGRAGCVSGQRDRNRERAKKGPPLRGGPAEMLASLSTVMLAPVREPQSARGMAYSLSVEAVPELGFLRARASAG